MNYRTFGRTGIDVSEIGIGGHREGSATNPGTLNCRARYFRTAQERARVIGRAIDQGVTYFDTTFGCEIESLGESLRILNRREGLFVSGMRVNFMENLLKDESDVRAYTRREVEARLTEFGFDHLDQFTLGAIEIGDTLAQPHSIIEDALDELSKLRNEGKLRFVGFSCHDNDYAGRMLKAFPQFDSVMTPYNFHNRTAEGEFANVLKQTHTAWIVMKPLVWYTYGVPITVLRNLGAAAERLSLDSTVDIARMGLQFILSNTLVSTTVPAVNSVKAVDENISASGRGSLSDEDLSHLQAYAAAGEKEDHLILTLCGLLEDNLRVRICAMGLGRAAEKLGLEIEKVDRAADDAEHLARQLARKLIDKASQDPRFASLLDKVPSPG